MKITVAVYGTLKRGYGNHRLLADARYVGDAVSGSAFQLFTVGFPVILPGTPAAPGKPIAVELYEVTRRELARLDRLEGNGRMYQRERRRFRLDGRSVRAWIYVGKSFRAEAMRRVESSGAVCRWDGQRPW